MSLKILIADDHAIIRHGVSLIVTDAFPDADIFLASNFNTLLNTLAETRLAVAICDVTMPGCNSLHMVQIIKKIQPELKIIIYSALDENIYAQLFIKAGANAFLNKKAENQELVDTLTCLLHKNKIKDGAIDHKSDTAGNGVTNPITLLSGRELEVANLLIKGFGTLEICNALELNKTTISTYKKRIYEKMRISTTLELASIYRNYSNAMV